VSGVLLRHCHHILTSRPGRQCPLPKLRQEHTPRAVEPRIHRRSAQARQRPQHAHPGQGQDP
jgi:hypothetical protein